MQNGKSKHWLRSWRKAVLGLWLLVALGAGASAVQAQSEDGIKAAFIYNFARFVEWPAAAFSGPSAPVTVGFVGGSGLADVFEQNTKGKNANGRDFAVKKLSGGAGVEQCQIVYVADAAQVGAVAAALKGKPVLLVGDAESLLESGGAIRFIKEGAKVVFDVHVANLAAAGLKVDPKLQKAARTVKGS